MAKFKTKFDSLVKLKKLKIDEIQSNISKINSSLQKELNNLQILENEFASMALPKEGNFAVITQFKMIQQAKIREINQKKSQIEFIKSQIENLNNQLKDANLEYEKIKYLQAEEIKKYIKKLKEAEAKNMDEIALMLYKN